MHIAYISACSSYLVFQMKLKSLCVAASESQRFDGSY
jgi:hypothetical protein